MIIKNQLICQTIGRRKSAIAELCLLSGKGNFIINNKIAEDYFQYNLNYLKCIQSPIKKVNFENDYQVIVKVLGGGLTGQSEAIKLALARALCNINNENRTILKEQGFLTSDSRVKERRKYGLKKARKASQYSKR